MKKQTKVLAIVFMGLFFANTSHAVIHGQPPTDDQAKRVAFLNYGADKMNTCTAVLISPTVLLTAAHCIHKSEKPTVYFGRSAMMGQTRSVTSMLANENYTGTFDNFGSVPGDVAVLKLSEPAPAGYQVTDLIGPNDPVDSPNAVVLGYGGKKFNAPAGPLLQSPVDLSTAKYGGDSVRLSPELVTGGDSGGPVLAMSNGQIKVYGINSTALRNVNQFTVKDIAQYRQIILDMICFLK